LHHTWKFNLSAIEGGIVFINNGKRKNINKVATRHQYQFRKMGKILHCKNKAIYYSISLKPFTALTFIKQYHLQIIWQGFVRSD